MVNLNRYGIVGVVVVQAFQTVIKTSQEHLPVDEMISKTLLLQLHNHQAARGFGQTVYNESPLILRI